MSHKKEQMTEATTKKAPNLLHGISTSLHHHKNLFALLRTTQLKNQDPVQNAFTDSKLSLVEMRV